MKILHVNHLLDPVSGGGTAERTFQLCRSLSKIGADCTILTLNIGITPARILALDSVKIVAVPCFNRRYFLPKMALSRIDNLVANADVVHLSGHWTILNALVYKSCTRQQKPYVFCPAGALNPFGRSVLLKRIYDAFVGKSLARSATACIAVTEDECGEFAAYGVAADRMVVIPNGINAADYNFAPEKNARESFRIRHGLGQAPYILFLGRLCAIKGPDLLLEAFSLIAPRFPEVQLVFSGPDGGMLSQLKMDVARLSLNGRVHFTGYIEGKEKAEALRSALLLAIPSRREAMSIVVLEAGVCETPVVFTDTCGLAEIAKDNAGYMVEVSSKSLAEKLSMVFSDKVKMRECAKRLNVVVLGRYQWSIQAERHMALYTRALAQMKSMIG